MHWMILPYRRYFDFSGRSRRLEYWMFALFYFLVCVLFALLLVLAIAANAGRDDPGPLLWMVMAGFALFMLASLIPSVAVSVRRFHDQERSGWMYLITFVPYVGWIIVLVFMVLEGTRGANRYGADPKDPDSTGVFA